MNFKKFVCLVTLSIGLTVTASAQTPGTTTPAPADTIWRKGGFFSVNFSQVSFSNWAAGGENSVSLNALSSLFANYKKGRMAWDNNVDLAYGLLKQGDAELRKNEDKIDLTTKFGYDATKKARWYYTVLFNFKSQFASGYTYTDTNKVEISKFAAPAYTLLAIGIDFKPKDYFSAFLSPITMKNTIVADKTLSDAGAYGVDSGKTVRSEMGAYFNMKFQKEVMTNVGLMTKIDLFSNYQENPQNVDVNWEFLITMKVNKYISASLSTQLIYDDNTPVTVYEGTGKDKHVVAVGPRTQFKQVFGVGFSYKFAGYGMSGKN